MTAGELLAQAKRGDAFVVDDRQRRPVLVALHTGDPTRPWEITGFPGRHTAGYLLYISGAWQPFRFAVDEEAAS